MRYCKQRRSYDCGPTAILNIMKWAGMDITLNDIPKLIIDTKCVPEFGTNQREMDRVIRSTFKYVRRIRSPKIEDINQALEARQAIIINSDTDNGGHYYSIINRSGACYVAINYITSKDRLPRTVLSDLLNRREFNPTNLNYWDYYTWAWIISKDLK